LFGKIDAESWLSDLPLANELKLMSRATSAVSSGENIFNKGNEE
jgi:hypothetical protein